MTRLLPILFLLAPLGFAGAAAAQTEAPATATVTIREAVTVSSRRPMRLQAVETSPGVTVSVEGGFADAPALVQVTGDPGRAYRIRVPQSVDADGTVVEGLRVSSLTSGDITSGGVARMDAEGRDLLTISGRLRRSAGAGASDPAPPLLVSITYE